MPDFDPYHRWLGIPPDEQPAGPHRLLGISPEENDPRVVQEAALRQTAFVRKVSMGEHGEHAERILGELAGARDRILEENNAVPEYEAIRPSKALNNRKHYLEDSSLEGLAATDVNDLLPPAWSTGSSVKSVVADVNEKQQLPINKDKSNSEILTSFMRELRSFVNDHAGPIRKALISITLFAAVASLFFIGQFFADTNKSQSIKIFTSKIDTNPFQTQEIVTQEKATAPGNDNTDISNLRGMESDKGLIAYYPFNGNANDESGYNQHGQIYGAKSTFDRFGRSSSAYKFNGINDRIIFDCMNGVFGEEMGFTVSIWLKNSMGKDVAFILTKGFHGNATRGGNQYLQIELANETPQFALYAGEISTGTWAVGKQNHAPINLWLHLVCVRDKQSAIYLNGIDVTDYSNSYTKKNNWTMDYNEALDGKPICIGALQSVGMDTFSKFFRGSLDDLRLYNRALSAEEVKSLYRFESVSTATSRSIPNIPPAISPAEARLESESPVLRKDEQESQLENGFDNNDFQSFLKVDPTNEVGLALKNEALNQALELGNFDEVLDICPDNREALAMKADKIAEFLAKGDYRMVFRLDPKNEQAIELALKAKNFTAILDYNPSHPDALALKSSHDEILWEKELESYRARALVGISSGSIREAYTLYNEIFDLLLSETQLIDDQYIGEFQVKRLEALLRVLDSLTMVAQKRELSSTELAYVNIANQSDDAKPRTQMIKEVARLKTIGGLPVYIIQILTPRINASTGGSYPFRE